MRDLCILLVDDSPVTRNLLQACLKGEGFTHFLEASHGLEALGFFEQKKNIDCIIADFNMPLMDGIAMCEKISAMTKGKIPPLIILTAEEDPHVKASFKQFNVSAWVSKPIDVKKIGRLVTKVMRDAYPD